MRSGSVCCEDCKYYTWIILKIVNENVTTARNCSMVVLSIAVVRCSNFNFSVYVIYKTCVCVIFVVYRVKMVKFTVKIGVWLLRRLMSTIFFCYLDRGYVWNKSFCAPKMNREHILPKVRFLKLSKIGSMCQHYFRFNFASVLCSKRGKTCCLLWISQCCVVMCKFIPLW